ncbi:hypothetical protein B9W62_00480 [Streptomyces sp. CS113]|uniref:hypothetical protein n=1 Tax=Streptomyces sp. CS113 TaxID=1982761 RepID=UPI000B408AE4|nr:hypothetical protein [Streptomyces sp. CS113]OWA13237.1 hypothetical protein B9W62_00480 [Streptomyces sp. CS113]
MPVHYDDAHIRELGQLWISTGEMLQEAVGVMDGAVSSMAGGWTGKAGHAAELVWNGVADHNIRHALLEAGTVAVEIGQAIINYADELQKAIDEINRAALIGALTTIFGMVLGVASFGIGAVLARLTSLVGQLVQSIASSISRIAAAAANVGRAAAFTADSVLNAGVTLGTDLFAGWLGAKAGHGPMHIDWESEGVNMGLGVWSGWGMGGVDILKGPNTAAGGRGLPNVATPGPAPSPSKASSLSVPHAGNNIPNVGLPHVGDLAPFPNSVVQTNHAPPTGAGVTNPVTAAPRPNAGAPGNATPLPGAVRPGQERPGTQAPGTVRPDSPVPHPLPTSAAGQTAGGGQPPHTVRPGQVQPEGTSPAVSGPAAPVTPRPGEIRTGGSTPAATPPNTPIPSRPGNQIPHTAGNDLATGNGTPPAAVRGGPSTPRTPHAFLDGPRSAGLPDAPAVPPSPHGGAGAVRETAPAGPGGVPRTNSPQGEQNTPTATSHAPGPGETTPRNTVTSHAGNPRAPLTEGAGAAGAGRATAPTPHGTPAEGARGTQPPARGSGTPEPTPVRPGTPETPAAAHHEAGSGTTAHDGPQGAPHRGARPVEPGRETAAVPARPDRAAQDTRGPQSPHIPAPDGGATPEQRWHTYRQEQNERTLPVVEAEARLEFRGEELTASWNRAYDTFAENNVFGGTRIARDGHQMRNAHWQWRHDITQQFRAEAESTGRVSAEAFDRIVHDAKASAHKYVVRADQKERFAAVVKERIDAYKANRFGDGELLPDFQHAPTRSVFDKDLNRFVKDDTKLYGHPDDGTATPADPFRDRSHDYNVLEQYYLAKQAQLDGILDRYLQHGDTGGGLPARTGRQIDALVEGVSDDLGALASRERDIRTATGEQFDDVVRWNSRGRDALSEDFVAKVRQDFEYDLRTDHDLVFRHGDGDGPRALWDLRTSRAIDELPARIAKEHFVRGRVAEETAFAQNHLSQSGEDFLGRFGEGGRERVVAEYLDAVRATAQRHFDQRLDSPTQAGETAAEWSGARDGLRRSLPDRIRHEGDLQAVVGEAAHAFHEIAGHPGSTEALALHEDTLSRLGNDFRTERVTRYDELFAPEGHRTSAWLSHESRGEDGFQARLDDLRDGDFVPELPSWSYPAFRDWRADPAPPAEGHPAARPGTPDRPVSGDGHAAPGHRTPTPAHDAAAGAPAPSRTDSAAHTQESAQPQPQPQTQASAAAPVRTQVTLDRDAAGAPGTTARTAEASAHTPERQHRAQQTAQALGQDDAQMLDLPAEVSRIVRRSSEFTGTRAQAEHAHRRLLEQRPDVAKLPATTQATLVADEMLRSQEQMRKAASRTLLRYTDRYPDNQRIHQVHQELSEQFGTEFQDLAPAQRADLVVARTLDENFGRPTAAPRPPVPSVDPAQQAELAETVRGILAERGIEGIPAARLDRAHQDLLNVGILTPRSALAERAAVVADFVTESERLTEAVNDELGARAGRPVSYEEVGDAAWHLASETGEAFTSLPVSAQVEAIADHMAGAARQDRHESTAVRTADKGKAVDRGRVSGVQERTEGPKDGFDQERALRELKTRDPLLRDLTPGELRDAFRIQEHTDPAVAGTERTTRLHHLGRIGRELHLHGAEAAWDLAGRLSEHGDRTGLFGGSPERAAASAAGRSADPSGATQTAAQTHFAHPEAHLSADPKSFLATHVLSLDMKTGLETHAPGLGPKDLDDFVNALSILPGHAGHLSEHRFVLSRRGVDTAGKAVFALAPAVEWYVGHYGAGRFSFHEDTVLPAPRSEGEYVNAVFVPYLTRGSEDYADNVGHADVLAHPGLSDPRLVLTPTMNGCAYAVTPSAREGRITVWHYQSPDTKMPAPVVFRREQRPTDWYGAGEYFGGVAEGQLFEVANMMAYGRDGWEFVSQETHTGATDTTTTLARVRSRAVHTEPGHELTYTKTAYQSLVHSELHDWDLPQALRNIEGVRPEGPDTGLLRALHDRIAAHIQGEIDRLGTPTTFDELRGLADTFSSGRAALRTELEEQVARAAAEAASWATTERAKAAVTTRRDHAERMVDQFVNRPGQDWIEQLRGEAAPENPRTTAASYRRKARTELNSVLSTVNIEINRALGAKPKGTVAKAVSHVAASVRGQIEREIDRLGRAQDFTVLRSLADRFAGERHDLSVTGEAEYFARTRLEKDRKQVDRFLPMVRSILDALITPRLEDWITGLREETAAVTGASAWQRLSHAEQTELGGQVQNRLPRGAREDALFDLRVRDAYDALDDAVRNGPPADRADRIADTLYGGPRNPDVDDLFVQSVNDLLTGMGRERVSAWRVHQTHRSLAITRGTAFSRGNSVFRAEAVATRLAGLSHTARPGGARDDFEQRPPRTRADDTTVVGTGKGKGKDVAGDQVDEAPEFVQGSASSGRVLDPDRERVTLDQALLEAYEDEPLLHGLPLDATREAFRIGQSEGFWVPGMRQRERLRELADIGWELHRNGPEAARELTARLAQDSRRGGDRDGRAPASRQSPQAVGPTGTDDFHVPVTVWRYDRTALPHTHTGQQGGGLWRDVRNPSRTATSDQLGLGPGHREHGDQFDEVTDRAYGSGNVKISTLGEIATPDRWVNTVRRVLPDAKRRVELALRELRAADGAPQGALLDALTNSFPLFQRTTPQEAVPFLAHLTEVLERVVAGLDSGTAAVTLVGRTSYHLAAALAEKAGAVGWVDPIARDVAGRLLDPHRMKRDEIAPVFARKGPIHLTKANDKDWDLAWTLVHEATHRYAGTDDYQYSSYEMERVEDALGTPRLENRQARDPMTYTGADESVLPAKQHNWYAMGRRSLMNADSFAQFVMTLTGERHAGLGRWYAGPGVSRVLVLDADLTQRVNRRLTRLGHEPVDAERAIEAYRELGSVGDAFAHLDLRARVERTARHIAGLGSDLRPGGARTDGHGAAAGQEAPAHPPERAVSILPTTEGIPGRPLHHGTATDVTAPAGAPERLLGSARLETVPEAEETEGAVPETPTATTRPATIGVDLEERRPPRLDRELPPAPTTTGPVKFSDGTRLPVQMAEGVGTRLTELPPDVVRRSFAFGQSNPRLRGIDQVVGELGRELATRESTRPVLPKGQKQGTPVLLEQVSRALRDDTRGFFGDGRTFGYRTANGSTRVLRVTARPYGTWERFTFGYANPVKNDVMRRSTTTGGQVKANGTSFGLSPSAPLGPLKSFLSPWARLHAQVNFGKQVKYNQQRQVINQTESRATDASHLHVDDVWYEFSVHDRRGRPVDLTGKAITDGDTARQAAGFGFAVRDGLTVRIPDSMTDGAPPAGQLPERMTMTGDARYRLVSTEDFGPVGHIHDWVVEQAGVGPGTVAAERIGEFFSTGGFHAMSRALNSGPVFTPPLLGGTHGADPLGVFSVRVESGEAVLISETKAAELRDITQSTSRNERQVGKARAVDVGAVLGPAFQLFELDGGALNLRAQAGLTARYATVRNRGTVSGGTAALKIAGQAKTTDTGLYLVHKKITVTAPPNKQAAPLRSGPGEGGRPGRLRKHSPQNWSEEPATRVFDTYAIERITRTEARRLAGLDKRPERTTPEPRAPRYLTENDPTTLGMSRVEEFTFTDGTVSKVVDGRTVTFPERFADAVLKEVGRAYPDLVAPLRELNPDNPRWRGADHFTTVLNNTLEIYNQLAHHSLATNVETMLTTGLRIDLVESATLSRGHRYVWIDAKLTGRRYEGDQQDLRVRFSAPGTEVVGGQRSGARGGQVGVEGMLSLGDTTPSDVGGVLQTGTLSAGVRAGGRSDSESGYGMSAANEQMSYNTGGSHLYSYDLRLDAKRGGYSRPRRWMRGLVLLNVLGTQPFVLGESESPLFTPRPGTQESAGLGRVLLSVPVEHTPAVTPATTARTESGPGTQNVPETVPEMTRQEALDLALGTGKALQDAAGREASVLASHPHQTVSVTSGPEMTRALEATLDKATGRSWTAGRKGAPVHDAAIQLTDSKTLRANHDQAATPMGWRAPELWAAAPYLNRATWLAHRTTVLPGLTALTRAETINSDSVVGGTLQASGRSARTSTLFFGGQLGFRRAHDAGTGVTGNYGLVLSPYRRDLSTSVTVQRSAVSEVTRRDGGRHALVAASLLHEFAVASDRLGTWALSVPHLPASLASAAGSRVVVPDGLLVHVPEKNAHRLGALKDAFGEVPLYKQRSWSPFPWLRGAFGGWPVNPLNTAAALKRFEEQLAPLGLTTQDREQLRRLVSGRVMRAMGKEMSGGTGASVPARIGRWGAEWAETWVGHRQVRLRARLVPLPATREDFGGLGHSVELEEARHAVESVQRAEGRSTGRMIGMAVSEGARTGDTSVPMAGPSYTQTGSSTQTRAQTRSEGTVDISTVAISQAHGEYATQYELRLDLEITDSEAATPRPARRGGAERALEAADDWWRAWVGRRRHRISVQQNVGRLIEHLPMSLMRPDPQLTEEDGAAAATADRPDPLAPPELDEQVPPHRAELPRAFGAGGWHDVAHPGSDSRTSPFEMPEQGFSVRGIVGLEGLHAANTLALGAAYDASLPVPEHGPVGPDLLARAGNTPLTRAGSGPAQSLEDGTSNGALAAFYGHTLTPDGYQVAGLTDRGFWGGADGSLTLYSKPFLSGARLLTVTDGAKFEHAHRSTHGAGASADRAGAAEHVLHAGPTTTSPALGTNQMGSGSGAQGLDSATSGQTGEQLASVNTKPDKARTFLFAIPTTWMSVAHVRHHVKDSTPARFVRSAFGNPQRLPQAVETEVKVLAWVREDVARQLGLIDDTLFPAEVSASWDAVADAEKAWITADENYWELRRGDGFESEKALAAAERTVSELNGGEPLPALSVEDARAALDVAEREDAFAEPAHDGWAEVRDGRIGLARAQLDRAVAQRRLNEVTKDLDALRAHADAVAGSYAKVREATDRLTNWHQLNATPQGRVQLQDTPAPPRAVFTRHAAPEPASRKPPAAVPQAPDTQSPQVRAPEKAPSSAATGEQEGETRPAYSDAPWQRGQDDEGALQERHFDAASDHRGLTATGPDGRRVFFDLHRPEGDGNGFYAAVLAARGSRTGDPARLAAQVARGPHIPDGLGLDPRAVFHTREVAAALDRAFGDEPGLRERIRERMSADGGRLPRALRSRLTPQEIRGLVRRNLLTARNWDAETAAAAAGATARTLAVDLTVVEENGTHTSYPGAVDDTAGPLPEVTVYRRGDAYLAAVPRTAPAAVTEATAARRALRQARLARAAAVRDTLARSAPAERLDAMAEFATAAQGLAEAFTRKAAFQERIDGAGSSADTRSAAAHAQVLDSALSRFDAAERRMAEIGLGDLSGRDDPLLPAELSELPAPRFLALMERAGQLLGSPAVVVGAEREVREAADMYRAATIAVAAGLLRGDESSARALAEDLSEQLGTSRERLPGGAVVVGGHDLTVEFWETARDLEEGLERDLEQLRARLDRRIQEANAPKKARSIRSRVSGWFGKRSRPVGPVLDEAEEIEEIRDEIATLPADVLREQRKHLADVIRHIERRLENEYRQQLFDEREWQQFRADRDRIGRRLTRLIVEPTGHRGHHDLLDRKVGRHPDFGAKRQDIKVDTYADLIRGVMGWIEAKPNRHAEKELALRVQSEGRVEPLLDVLLTRIHTHVRGLPDGPRMLAEMEAGVSHADGTPLGAYLRYFNRRNLPQELAHLATTVGDRGGMAGVLRDPATFGFRDKMMVLHDLMEYFKASSHYPKTYGSGLLPEDTLHDQQATILVDAAGRRTHSSAHRAQNVLRDGTWHPSTRDEHAPSTLLARELRIPVWAGQSNTAMRMFKLARWAGASRHEIAAEAWGIFAFWRLHYDHRETLAYHTLHETMDVASNFEVPYSLTDRAAGLADVSVEAALTEMETKAAELGLLATQVGRALRILFGREVSQRVEEALDEVDPAIRTMSTSAAAIERGVRTLRPRAAERLTGPDIRTLTELLDHERKGLAALGTVAQHAPVVTAALQGGSREHGLDPRVEGWETGRGITLMAPRFGLLEREQEQLLTGPAPRGGKAAEEFRSFSRQYPYASRSYQYEVGTAGTLVLPDGSVLTGDWTRFGDDFLHEQGFVLRGDHGWIGRILNWDELRAVLPADPARYSLTADASRMYLAPVGQMGRVVVLPLAEEHTATDIPVAEEGTELAEAPALTPVAALTPAAALTEEAESGDRADLLDPERFRRQTTDPAASGLRTLSRVADLDRLLTEYGRIDADDHALRAQVLDRLADRARAYATTTKDETRRRVVGRLAEQAESRATRHRRQAEQASLDPMGTASTGPLGYRRRIALAKRTWQEPVTEEVARLERLLLEAGPGARSLVLGAVPGDQVWAMNIMGEIRWLEQSTARVTRAPQTAQGVVTSIDLDPQARVIKPDPRLLAAEAGGGAARFCELVLGGNLKHVV